MYSSIKRERVTRYGNVKLVTQNLFDQNAIKYKHINLETGIVLTNVRTKREGDCGALGGVIKREKIRRRNKMIH